MRILISISLLIICVTNKASCWRLDAHSSTKREPEAQRFFRAQRELSAQNDFISGETPSYRNIAEIKGSKFHTFLSTSNKTRETCAEIKENQRIGLFDFVPAHHGSTSLFQLLMSTRSLSTMCRAGSWQCEAQSIRLRKNGTKSKKFLKDYVEEEDTVLKVEAILSYAETQKNVILLQKVIDYFPYGLKDNTTIDLSRLDIFRYIVKKRELPRELRQKGVTEIVPVAVIMYRPYCLRDLSLCQSPIEHETKTYHNMLNFYKEISKKVKVIVVNYADLLFDQKAFSKRMSLIPCLNAVNFDFVPVNNVDIFPRNKWKLQYGSIREYTSKLSAEEYDYNVKEKTCSYEGDRYLDRHTGKQLPAIRAIIELESRLLKLSS